FLARAISSGRVEMPREGGTAINIGFSATNPIGRKSCGTWIGTFGAAGCKETKVDNTGHLLTAAIGTNRKSPHARCEVGCQGLSRLVMLTLSSSGCDPQETCTSG